MVRAAKLSLLYKFFRECYGTPKVLFITASMGVVQTVGAQLPPLAYKIVACIFFAGMSLKSRVFAVLDARRPELGSDLGNKIMVETKRPAWTPPGLSLSLTCMLFTLVSLHVCMLFTLVSLHVKFVCY